MSEERKSVYVLGAEDGLFLGPIMALALLLIGWSTYTPWLSLPGVAACVAVPVIAYMRLAVSYRQTPSFSFSALWLQGICMFFFGGLIMAVAAFVALRWIAPDFIIHQVDLIISVYGSIDNPDAKLMAETFEKLKNTGTLPTAFDMTLEFLYIAVFTGSILSLVYSAIIRRKKA